MPRTRRPALTPCRAASWLPPGAVVRVIDMTPPELSVKLGEQELRHPVPLDFEVARVMWLHTVAWAHGAHERSLAAIPLDLGPPKGTH